MACIVLLPISGNFYFHVILFHVITFPWTGITNNYFFTADDLWPPSCSE